jgi:hypothetical protein
VKIKLFIFLFCITITCFICTRADASEDGTPKTLEYVLISSQDITHVNDGLRASISTLLPESKEKYLEYNSPQAQAYIDELSVTFIPYVVFDRSIALNDKFFHMVKNNMIEQKKGYYVIPDDQLNMGEIMLLGRQRQPGELSVFVMSMCPYAKEALASLIDFIRRNDVSINLRVKYIVNYNEFGIHSPYGPDDIRENLRQITIQDKYPDKFFDYILLMQSIAPEDALKQIGVSAAEIDAGKDNALLQLKQDFDEKESLGIRRSPTFLFENTYIIPSLEGLSQHSPFNVKKKS